MVAQIPLEQDEHAGVFRTRAEQRERFGRRGLFVVAGGVQIVSEHLVQMPRREPLQPPQGAARPPLEHVVRRFGCRRRVPGSRQDADERQRFRFVLRFQRGPHHLLAAPHVADERVDERFGLGGPRAGEGAEVGAAVGPRRRRGQVEGEQRAAIVLRHPDQGRPGRLAGAALQGRQPVDGRHAPGVADTDPRGGILERQARGLARPDQDIGIDCRHRLDLKRSTRPIRGPKGG